jgi:DNA-binding NarL/FixJ family response regulator
MRAVATPQSPVGEIRILLADMPTMLREILSSVLKPQAGMIVMDISSSLTSLLAAVNEAAAHIVILGQDEPTLTAQCRELLEQHPRVQVMAISTDGLRTTICGLRPYREPLGEVEPEQLVDAIREMATTSRAW